MKRRTFNDYFDVSWVGLYAYILKIIDYSEWLILIVRSLMGCSFVCCSYNQKMGGRAEERRQGRVWKGRYQRLFNRQNKR